MKSAVDCFLPQFQLQVLWRVQAWNLFGGLFDED